MLNEHTEEIEADFQDIGIDLVDLFRGRLTWRKFGVLLRQLPRSSRLSKVRDPAAEWTIAEHLQALTVDALAGANWQRAGSKKLKAPDPIKRPGSDGKQQQLASLAEQLIAREGGDHG